MDPHTIKSKFSLHTLSHVNTNVGSLPSHGKLSFAKNRPSRLPFQGSGSHIGSFESKQNSTMLAVFFALKAFLLALKGHHVLVRLDSMTVLAYINRQGGLRSHSLDRMARRLLFWSQKELLSLRVFNVPSRFNLGTYMLSRGNVASGEWALHPQTVKKSGQSSGRQSLTSSPQKTTLTALHTS